MGTKGAFLWDVLLNLRVEANDEVLDENHLHIVDEKRMKKKRSSKSLSLHHVHGHQSKGSDLLNHSPRNANQSNTEFTYNRRSYKQKSNSPNSNRREVGGNTQVYPDSSYPYSTKSQPSKNEKLYM